MMKKIILVLLMLSPLCLLAQERTADENGLWGFMENGRWVVEPKYDDVGEFSNNMAAVCMAGKWGYVNRDGVQVIPYKFEYAGEFTSHLAPVSMMGKFGYVDKRGNVVIPYKFDGARPFHEGYAAVSIAGKWGFIDTDGNQTIPFQYEGVSDFHEGLAELLPDGNRKSSRGNKTWRDFPTVKYWMKQLEKVKSEDYKGSMKLENVEKNLALNIEIGKKLYGDGEAGVDGGKSEGFIDYEGNFYADSDDYVPPFSVYAKRVIEEKVNLWQQKGKYEKTADWQARVNDANRKIFIDSLYSVAQNDYIAFRSSRMEDSQTLVNYDADNEVFLITDAEFGDLLVQVPIEYAPDFEAGFDSMDKDMRYYLNGDHLALAEVVYNLGGHEFRYSSQADLRYTELDIEYNFEPVDIEVESPALYADRGSQTISRSNVSIGVSDVDTDIPQASSENDRTFVVILANENYNTESRVEYAHNDGEVFSRYCNKTLGIPESNIRVVFDATLNNIRAQVDWLSKVGEAYGGDARLMFYYAGHGIPDESSKEAYILPVDGYGSNVATGYKLSELYAQLSAIPSSSTLVFLDACFSGANRDDQMLASVRGIAVRVKKEVPQGNLVIFSAAQGDETALPYNEQGHGMFTYFLLKKLQETGGNVSLGDLSDYVTDQVRKMSVVTKSKPQTPTVSAGVSISDWRSIKL